MLTENINTISDINNHIIPLYNSLNESSESHSDYFPSDLRMLDLETIIDKTSFEEIVEKKNDVLYKVENSCDEKSKKIFSIKKVKKKGRHKKNSNKKGKHDKYNRDNIIRRFKVHLMRNIFNYINSLFTINQRSKKYKKIIKMISSSNTKLISKKDNLEWLNSSLKKIFSQNVSKRAFNFNSNYNQKLINKIYKENKEINVIKLLDKTIREMWIIYINDDIEKSYDGFSTLKDDIKKLKEIGETEYYINLYINVSQKFEEIFNSITSKKNNL
jgi:hypothetical protein